MSTSKRKRKIKASRHRNDNGMWGYSPSILRGCKGLTGHIVVTGKGTKINTNRGILSKLVGAVTGGDK